jgi:hypothetical protein
MKTLRHLKKLVLFLSLITLPALVSIADPPGGPDPGGDPGTGGGTPVGSPLGEGAWILVALGGIYGAIRIRGIISREKQQEDQ